MEVWILTCVIMVFASLLEYGSIFMIKFWNSIPLEQINHMPTRINRIRNNQLKSKNQDQTKIRNKGNAFVLRDYNNGTKDDNRKLNAAVNGKERSLSLLLKLDSFSLIAFPAVFFLFVTTYLFVYLVT